MNDLVHLHNHTKYSILDGAITTDRMIKRLKDLNMDTFAVSDHGTLGAIPEFTAAGTKHGIKIIAGIEIYEVDNIQLKTAEEASQSTDMSCEKEHKITKDDERKDLAEISGKKEEKYWHLTLLAKNKEGYKQLCKLSALSATKEAYYYKPRVDRQMLTEIVKGGNIIVGTGCAGSRICKYAVKSEDYAGFSDRIDGYLKIFGTDNIMCEIMANGYDKQGEINEKLIQWATKKGLPIVVTNDAHYATIEDARLQDILLCIATNQIVDDPNRKFKFEGTSYYLRSKQEAIDAFKLQYNIDLTKTNYIDNTIIFADKCEHSSYIEEKDFRLPKFDVQSTLEFQNFVSWTNKNKSKLVDKGYNIDEIIK